MKSVICHTPFVYVSILSYILGDNPRFWRHERKIVLKPGPYTTNSLCTRTAWLIHCVEIGKSHALNTLDDVNDLNHTVPTFTNFVLSASCVVNLFAGTQYIHSLTLTSENETYFDRQEVNFPSICILDTYHCKKFIIFYSP